MKTKVLLETAKDFEQFIDCLEFNLKKLDYNLSMLNSSKFPLFDIGYTKHFLSNEKEYNSSLKPVDVNFFIIVEYRIFKTEICEIIQKKRNLLFVWGRF